MFYIPAHKAVKYAFNYLMTSKIIITKQCTKTITDNITFTEHRICVLTFLQTKTLRRLSIPLSYLLNKLSSSFKNTLWTNN